MRWERVLQAIGVVAGLIMAPAGTMRAQDIDDLDLELDFNVLRRFNPKSFWAELTDNRANRRQSFDYLSLGMPDRMIYFAGVDASKWSLGVFGGAQWMPNGFGRNGFILRMFLSESIERYTDRRVTYDTQIGRAHILPGYMFRLGNAEIQLLAGLDAEADFFFRDGRANQWRTRIGVRGIADVWWEPTPDLMLQYALSGTSIDNGYATRIAGGWRVSEWFWIGPEAAFSKDYFSEQTRLGAHVTGLRTGDYEWSVAAGRVSDNFGREGIYGRVGVMVRPRRAPFIEN